MTQEPPNRLENPAEGHPPKTSSRKGSERFGFWQTLTGQSLMWLGFALFASLFGVRPSIVVWPYLVALFLLAFAWIGHTSGPAPKRKDIQELVTKVEQGGVAPKNSD